MGDGFRTDAEELKAAARDHLDPVAAALEDTRSAISEAGWYPYAFSGGPNPGTLFESLEGNWNEILHYFNRIFEDNIENLELGSEALKEVAQRYIETDSAGAEGMPS